MYPCISRYIDINEKNLYDNGGLMYCMFVYCISRYIDVNEKNVYCMAGIYACMYVYPDILM